jgi:hypothetical protein
MRGVRDFNLGGPLGCHVSSEATLYMMRTSFPRGLYSGRSTGAGPIRSLLVDLRRHVAGASNTGKRRLVRELPPWYPLDIYSADLSARGWLGALSNRFYAEYLYRHTEANFNLFIVDPPMTLRPDVEFVAGLNDWAKLGGVRDLPAYDAAYIALHILAGNSGRRLLRDVSRIHRILQRGIRRGDTKRRSKAERQARCRSFAAFVGVEDAHSLVGALSGVPVVVDVTQDDESLMMDFKKWLRNVRRALGRASRPFTKRDFAAWKEYRLLETFDLTLWSQIQGIRYSDSFLAKTLWPNAHFDGVERLRKVTRPRLREILGDLPVLQRLYRQAELQYLRPEAP